MTDWKRRETELRNDLDFLELFQTVFCSHTRH